MKKSVCHSHHVRKVITAMLLFSKNGFEGCLPRIRQFPERSLGVYFCTSAKKKNIVPYVCRKHNCLFQYTRKLASSAHLFSKLWCRIGKMAQVIYNSERVNPDKCLLTLWWCVYKRNLFCLLSAVEWLSHGSCPHRWVFLTMPRLLHHLLGGRCFEEWGELCVASPISCSLLLSGIRWNHGQHWAISWISPKFLIGVQASYSYCTTGIVVALSAAATMYIPSDLYRSRITFSTKIFVSFAVGYLCACVHLFL